jgi:hypothetical protein
MTAMSAAGASTLAHGIHFGIVLAGLVGLAALLAPQVLTRAGLTDPGPPRDEHEARVADLRRRLATGDLGGTTLLLPTPVVTGSRAALPLAVVASAAAAGAHAAVGPPHLEGQVLVGAFFLVCALGQVGWSALVLRGSTPALLLAGLLGNAAVLTLWLVSRTAGLPGVPHSPEPFGPWDLTCAVWELIVVAVCATRLQSGRAAEGVAPWASWTPAVHGLLATSVFALAMLSLIGASA